MSDIVPKSELERIRSIREARALYDSIFPPTDVVRERPEGQASQLQSWARMGLFLEKKRSDDIDDPSRGAVSPRSPSTRLGPLSGFARIRVALAKITGSVCHGKFEGPGAPSGDHVGQTGLDGSANLAARRDYRAGGPMACVSTRSPRPNRNTVVEESKVKTSRCDFQLTASSAKLVSCC